MRTIVSGLPGRFWEKVNKTDSCWLWTASRSTPGYGQFKFDGSNVPTHKLAYEDRFGDVPDGFVLDHLCRVRHCVNPTHLEPVTPAENTARGERATKTHCDQNHPLDGGGNGRRRYCKRCKLAKGNLWRRTKAAS